MFSIILSGPPPLAKEAQLVVVLSGDIFAKKHAEKLLVPAMGRKIIDVGANVERASSFKLLGNSCVLGVIELLAESMTLADKTGVGADLLYEFIKEFLREFRIFFFLDFAYSSLIQTCQLVAAPAFIGCEFLEVIRS